MRRLLARTLEIKLETIKSDLKKGKQSPKRPVQNRKTSCKPDVGNKNSAADEKQNGPWKIDRGRGKALADASGLRVELLQIANAEN